MYRIVKAVFLSALLGGSRDVSRKTNEMSEGRGYAQSLSTNHARRLMMPLGDVVSSYSAQFI